MTGEIRASNKSALSLEVLKENPYPGRGIVIGLNESGDKLIQIYFLTGRHANSRNRVLTPEGGRVFTEPADPSKVEDPSLIIYNAMDELNLIGPSPLFWVTNGVQTDTIMKCVSQSLRHGFEEALWTHRYEPDPSSTPRIAGICSHLDDKWSIEMASIRKSPWNDSCEHHFHHYPGPHEQGVGVCLTTYSGNGDPLPAYRGEPFPVPIVGGIEEIASNFWSALCEEHRIALAVKAIDVTSRTSEVKIIKRYQKVA